MLISRKKDWIDLRKVKKLNEEYIKIKRLYNTASESNKTTDWKNAKKAYKEYYTKIYNKDIDALLEFADICTELGEISESIKYIEEAQERMPGNPTYLIRLGINRAKEQDFRNALEFFRKLIVDDNVEEETNEKLLLNCATCCIKIAGQTGTGTDKKKAIDFLERITKRLNQFSPNTSTTTAVKKSLERIHNKKSPLEDHKIVKLTKLKAGNQMRLVSELRLGVLIYLNLFEGATKYQIRKEWLNSKNATDEIIKQLVDGEFIEKKLTLSDGNPVFSIKQNGISYAEQYVSVFEKIVNDKSFKTNELGAVFTEKLINAWKKWNSKANEA